MGSDRLWVLTVMGYDRSDCIYTLSLEKTWGRHFFEKRILIAGFLGVKGGLMFQPSFNISLIYP